MEHTYDVSQNILPLISAVETGNNSKVSKFLEQNISVETTDENGNSLLHIAAANGRVEIVRLLSMKGASLDRNNLYGWTPLMQAARYGHENVALHLLQNKAKINATTPLGVTALTLAIFGGHSKMVELLLNNSELVLDDSESISYFISPLAVATMYGRDDSLRLLLKKGLSPDQKYKSTEWTSLMISALTGQLPMARLLVNKGANPNLKNKLGKTALEIATDCAMSEVRGYLDRKTMVKPEGMADKADSIISAVKEGNYQKVSDILKTDKSQANKTSSDGATPLMYASINGHLLMIELLVDNGADLDAKDYENGWTALMQATYYGKTQAAIKLILYGANVHIRAINGVTAFDMAMLINLHDTNLFRMLAERMMDKNKDPPGPNAKLPSKAWANLTGTSASLISNDTTSVPPAVPNNKRSFWSKMTKTMRGMKMTRSSKNSILPNKVSTSTFEETLIAPERTDSNELSKQYDTTAGNVSISNPYALTNHSGPTTHFPSDKLSPVVPPFQTSTGVDKQSMSAQKKLSNSKASMSNSLNSSGESSVSRSVVRPFKFLQSPNSSGRCNSNSTNNSNPSPHSSGGATSVTGSFPLSHQRPSANGKHNPHSRSGDRNSDSVLVTMPKKRQRKPPNAPASVDGSFQREGISIEEVSKHRDTRSSSGDIPHRSRVGSRAGSVASSENTSSTLTPPRSVHGQGKGAHSVSSKSNRSSKSSRKLKTTKEQDELGLILQKLSLEKYHPIFEQQEIDMDAFLTLTQGDLSELGITQEQPRQMLLKAIKQINVGKDERSVSSGSSGNKYSSVRSGSRLDDDLSRRSWAYSPDSLPHVS